MTEVDGYLLDTSVLSALHDSGHPKHEAVKNFLDELPPGDLVLVSAVAIAELRYGAALWEAAERQPLLKVTRVLAGAKSYNIRDITRHTSEEYANIKTKVAFKYLKNPMDKKERTPWIED